MFRRRLAAMLITVLLVAAVPATTLADTVGRKPAYDVFQAILGFTFTDEAGTAWNGGMYIIEERIAHTLEFGLFFSADGPVRTCDRGTPDPGDDFQAMDYVEFTAYLPDDNITINERRIARDLSKAKLDASVRGHRITYHQCGFNPEAVSDVLERHTFSFDLDSTGSPPETVLVECNGGVEEITTIREASGQGGTVLDHEPVTLTQANLTRVTGTLGAAC